jgi:hypothetical protein
MNHEIHMFSAVAVATATSGFPEGEHHPMLIFVRQPPDTGHDLAAAASVATQAGWIEVDITRAGTLPPDAPESMGEAVCGAYSSAVETGAGMTVFAAVVRAAPRKG